MKSSRSWASAACCPDRIVVSCRNRGWAEATQVGRKHEGALGGEDRGDLVEGPHVVGEPVEQDCWDCADRIRTFVGDLQHGRGDLSRRRKRHHLILSQHHRLRCSIHDGGAKPRLQAIALRLLTTGVPDR